MLLSDKQLLNVFHFGNVIELSVWTQMKLFVAVIFAYTKKNILHGYEHVMDISNITISTDCLAP